MAFLTINKKSHATILSSLYEITSNLITNTVLQINKRSFSFIDLEFYYWNHLHQDDYAKGINHHRELGELELHRYGIDLSLGNSSNDFGGILIRGLFDLDNQVVIQKSNIAKVLFNELFIGENYIEIMKRDTPWTNVFSTSRIKLGTADTEGKKNYKDSLYRVIAKNKRIFENYDGKEIIFRNSNLTDEEIQNLLGYTIK